jgi:choline dehydrogenase
MDSWDYIIVGAGAAGCVLAERLSVDPANNVLLLEAGPADSNPFIHMPRGIAKLFGNSQHMWHFQTESENGAPSEIWPAGKVLGGSSSVNGMLYFRGQPQDYDEWAALGARGWGWEEMAKSFREIETHELGGSVSRGDAGPLHISVQRKRTPLTESFIKAGEQMNVPRVSDLNELRTDGQGVGYATWTIYRGRRQSSATAFLNAAKGRPNLKVVTNTTVDKVLFADKRCVGVDAIASGQRKRFTSTGEVILSAGTLMSPQILQRSGIGEGKLLRELGIDVVVDSPGVGRHMRDHRILMTQYDINVPYSENFKLSGWRLAANVLRYYLQHKGAMAAAYATIGAFAKVLPESETADAEVLFSPLVATPNEAGNLELAKVHSFQLASYPLRPRSEGSVCITSRDPSAPASIRAGYLHHPYDQQVTVALFRFLKKWVQQPAISGMIVSETGPFRSLVTREEIIDSVRTKGGPGFHSCGSCRMGDFPDAVLNERCQVRGVNGLRVIDGSIMPSIVSANTSGPIMASAWRAAKLILAGPHNK